MKIYPFVLAGTAIGAGGVLAFPTHAATTMSKPVAVKTRVTAPPAAPETAPSVTASPATSPAPAPTQTTTPAPPPPQTATGADITYKWGDLAVQVTVSDKRVVAAQMAKLNNNGVAHSVELENMAVPQLLQQAVAAGNANIQGVTGATYTTDAFKQSFESALQQLGLP